MKIRLAVAEEQAILLDLYRRSSLSWGSDRQLLEANLDSLQFPLETILSGDTLVADIAGIIVGLVVVLPEANGEAEMKRLFVDPGWFRQGIGTKLVAAAIALARDRRATVMNVSANPQALGFYEAKGFRKVGERETQLGQCISMQMTLCHSGDELVSNS